MGLPAYDGVVTAGGAFVSDAPKDLLCLLWSLDQCRRDMPALCSLLVFSGKLPLEPLFFVRSCCSFDWWFPGRKSLTTQLIEDLRESGDCVSSCLGGALASLGGRSLSRSLSPPSLPNVLPPNGDCSNNRLCCDDSFLTRSLLSGRRSN